MTAPTLIGGSPQDQQDILALHQRYLDANASFDWPTLRDSLWSESEDAFFFNLNGHTYKGRSAWVRLWQFYAERLQSGAWIPYDIGGEIAGSLAVVWCHRKTRLRWTGDDKRPDDKAHQDRDFISRSTMVMRKEQGGWRIGHVHFSEVSTGERPGGI